MEIWLHFDKDGVDAPQSVYTSRYKKVGWAEAMALGVDTPLPA